MRMKKTFYKEKDLNLITSPDPKSLKEIVDQFSNELNNLVQRHKQEIYIKFSEDQEPTIIKEEYNLKDGYNYNDTILLCCKIVVEFTPSKEEEEKLLKKQQNEQRKRLEKIALLEKELKLLKEEM